MFVLLLGNKGMQAACLQRPQLPGNFITTCPGEALLTFHGGRGQLSWTHSWESTEGAPCTFIRKVLPNQILAEICKNKGVTCRCADAHTSPAHHGRKEHLHELWLGFQVVLLEYLRAHGPLKLPHEGFTGRSSSSPADELTWCVLSRRWP